jgi:MOSC domain-containing protein YiiM
MMWAMWQGQVVSLHIGREAGAPLVVVPQVHAVPGRGLEGDRYFLGRGHYSARPSFGGRDVTLIEMETIEALEHGVVSAAGDRLGIKVSAAETRRNIATAGVPLNHLVGATFWVGAVQMRGTRLCEPCQYLEDLTGRPRLMSGLLHRGGLRAQILSEGVIRVGDSVRPA